MTQPPIHVGQIWVRRDTGQRVLVTAITPTNLVTLRHLDRSRSRPNGYTTHPMASSLRSTYRLATDGDRP